MPSLRVRHSLIDQMNIVDGQFREPNKVKYSEYESSGEEPKTTSVMGTPGRSKVWCIGRDGSP